MHTLTHILEQQCQPQQNIYFTKNVITCGTCPLLRGGRPKQLNEKIKLKTIKQTINCRGPCVLYKLKKYWRSGPPPSQNTKKGLCGSLIKLNAGVQTLHGPVESWILPISRGLIPFRSVVFPPSFRHGPYLIKRWQHRRTRLLRQCKTTNKTGCLLSGQVITTCFSSCLTNHSFKHFSLGMNCLDDL